MSICRLPGRVDAMKNVLPSRDVDGQPSVNAELKFGCAPGHAFSIRTACVHGAKGPSCALAPASTDSGRGATASFVVHPSAAVANVATAASASCRQ